ncbi:Rz1-like lysis system protein LysC [Candidatus Williamhamiltonella defendens]|uniref:Rz1-like lysis system protein LysC n=1 Tax=Candidatus Williamhamiltonella defendens TaxID=138072 RepID=UPI003BB53BB7
MLICLCLLLLLTGCVRTPIKYIPVRPVPIPDTLLDDCSLPVISEHMTWGDSLILNEQLLLALEMCNQDKAAIRRIEEQRNDSRKWKVD